MLSLNFVINDDRFYGGSESLKTRVFATVCQKNEGYSYVSEVEQIVWKHFPVVFFVIFSYLVLKYVVSLLVRIV